jgi:hypothetical protein
MFDGGDQQRMGGGQPRIISLRPGSPRRSTSNDGEATRNASIGTSDCPPASALASPSCAASSATASASVAGHAYSNAGSFMRLFRFAGAADSVPSVGTIGLTAPSIL